MLEQLIERGFIWRFGGSFVGRTTDGVKFGLGSADRPEDTEKFLRLYWDAELKGISVIAPDNWDTNEVTV